MRRGAKRCTPAPRQARVCVAMPRSTSHSTSLRYACGFKRGPLRACHWLPVLLSVASLRNDSQ
eukprot:5938968-Karenia_brevis.AAC.1